MSARWKKLGAKPADKPYCDFYARKLAEAGWSDSDINEAIAFGLKHQNEGWAKFEGLAIHELQSRGIDGTYINELLTPGDIIQEQPDIRASLEAHSFAEAHANPTAEAPSDDARLAEIQQTMREDPDAYWGSAATQREFATLIAAREGHSDGPSAPTGIERRRAEIETLMTENGGRGYWSRPEVQNEYAALVAASMPQEAADVGH